LDWESKEAEEEEERAASETRAQRLARETDRARARRAAEVERHRNAPLRAARRDAEKAEQEVLDAERAVADLEAALAHPDLYDGSMESAQEAGRLNVALKDAREELDAAMARWARAVEQLDDLGS
jgi:hypothetical protein